MTAVEWLIERIESTSHDLHHLMKVRGEFEQAKQMEKEQHEETFKQSRQSLDDGMPPVWESWEQYYKETFDK